MHFFLFQAVFGSFGSVYNCLKQKPHVLV